MSIDHADVQEITTRFDVVIKLLAALLARDLNNNEAIVKLNDMQLSREQIATALGITTQNIRQVLYMNNKKTAKKAKVKAGSSVEGQPLTIDSTGELELEQ